MDTSRPNTFEPLAEVHDNTQTPNNIESIWKEVFESTSKFDDKRIRIYKEDIDTILVFAGLYSAVLVGLLAESIDNLKQDPQDIIISLLRQLTSQSHSYSLNSGFLNSTAPTPNLQPPPFTPSPNAKRANILWFASLMLSLISASFGILAKQWLREYSTMPNATYQERARIRHFRAPGLEHWKVFEIAAFLLLVLQLSLALFFVGLCFFTLDIHRSVGYATIPLVVGWATLFAAAGIAPVISSRCPYKIQLLQSIIMLSRRILIRSIDSSKRFLETWWRPAWFPSLSSEKAAVSSNDNDVDILLSAVGIQMEDSFVQTICSALRGMPPDSVVKFVSQVIRSRLVIEVPTPIPSFLDLRRLPPHLCTILMDTIAHSLTYAVNQIDCWEQQMHNCIALLCSQLPCDLSPTANKALLMCFTQCYMPDGTNPLKRILTTHPDIMIDPQLYRQRVVMHLLDHLRPVVLHLESRQFHAYCLSLAQLWCHRSHGDKNEREPKVCTEIDVNILYHGGAMGSAVEGHFLRLFIDYLSRELDFNVTWSDWHLHILSAICQQQPFRVQWELRDSLVSKTLAHPIHHRLCYMLFDYAHYNASVVEVCKLVFKLSEDPQQILDNVKSSLAIFLDGAVPAMVEDPENLEDFRNILLQFTLDQIDWMEIIADKEPLASDIDKHYAPIWRVMGHKLADALQSCNQLSRPYLPIAANVLKRAHDLNQSWQQWTGSVASETGTKEPVEPLVINDLLDAISVLTWREPYLELYGQHAYISSQENHAQSSSGADSVQTIQQRPRPDGLPTNHLTAQDVPTFPVETLNSSDFGSNSTSSSRSIDCNHRDAPAVQELQTPPLMVPESAPQDDEDEENKV